MGILSLLLWTPALGALLLAAIPRENIVLTRLVANACSTFCLLLAGWLLSQYDPNNGQLQFHEYFPLNPALGSAYALGVDGLSLPLLLLTCLLTTITLAISCPANTSAKGHCLCLLLIESGLLGVFLTQDWALFFLFWQLTLIPLFFLMNRWGELRRHAASLRFATYLMGGSVFLLISLLAISQFGLQQDGPVAVPIFQVAKAMPKNQQILVLLGFLLGFGVNMALFPLHGWLPLAQTAAPGAVNILISGVFLKMGGYGLTRAVVMLPDAAQALQPLMTTLALFGMIYGSLLAWRQTELKAMLAYWSISQMAVVLLGIASLNDTGLTGAVLQMVAHGLIAAVLFLLIGPLYRQTSTRNLFAFNPGFKASPKFSALMVLSLLAAMALPGTIGFIASIHTLIGNAQRHYLVTAVFLLTGLITAAYLTRTLNQLCLGSAQQCPVPPKELARVEFTLAGVLVAAIVLLGLMPSPWLHLSAATVKKISPSSHSQTL